MAAAFANWKMFSVVSNTERGRLVENIMRRHRCEDCIAITARLIHEILGNPDRMTDTKGSPGVAYTLPQGSPPRIISDSCDFC